MVNICCLPQGVRNVDSWGMHSKRSSAEHMEETTYPKSHETVQAREQYNNTM